jgi:hypothetical protein
MKNQSFRGFIIMALGTLTLTALLVLATAFSSNQKQAQDHINSAVGATPLPTSPATLTTPVSRASRPDIDATKEAVAERDPTKVWIKDATSIAQATIYAKTPRPVHTPEYLLGLMSKCNANPTIKYQFACLNEWSGIVNNKRVMVQAGSKGDDYEQGVIYIFSDLDKSFDSDQIKSYFTAEKRGGLVITSVDEKTLKFNLVTKQGATLQFDYNTKTLSLVNNPPPATPNPTTSP